MHTNTTHRDPQGVDPAELDRHIAEMYRDVANEAVRDLHFPTGRPLAEALGYPADLRDGLPAQAVNSFAGVGPAGSVTGVDITPEQLAKSERMGRQGYVSFRRARIEELPFDDASFDAVISNGAVNLSADKRLVFAEAARVLRPGGRLALADIVTEREISARTTTSPASARDTRATSTAHTACRCSRSSPHLHPATSPNPNLGSGAEVAQAAREESPINTTTTEEVPK